MLRAWIGEPNPPAGARSSGRSPSRTARASRGRKSPKNRSKRRKKPKMARKQRDRRGRFLKGSRKRSHGRRSGGKRRRARASNTPRRTRRRRARSSNPPTRRRRSHSRRRSNAPRARVRHVYHRARRRRSNPPYTIKTLLIGAVIVGAGYAGAKLVPMAIVKLAKKPAWGMGWKAVGLSAGSTVLVAGIGYGIGRLLSSKRVALMVGGELLIGGTIATAHEAYHAWKTSKPAAAQAPATPMPAPAGQSGFTPEQVKNARSAASVLRAGQGFFSPEQYAQATTGGALMTGFGPERNF